MQDSRYLTKQKVVRIVARLCFEINSLLGSKKSANLVIKSGQHWTHRLTWLESTNRKFWMGDEKRSSIQGWGPLLLWRYFVLPGCDNYVTFWLQYSKVTSCFKIMLHQEVTIQPTNGM